MEAHRFSPTPRKAGSPDGEQVTMVHEDLAAAPLVDLSPELRLHWYHPGNEAWWVAIHARADRFNTVSERFFAEQFADRRLRLSDRQCYLLDARGEAVATATAWAAFQGPFAGYGQVHWVAVVPGCQGRGIGAMILSIVCRRLLARGHARAFLYTATLRPVAIRLYERFGFKKV